MLKFLPTGEFKWYLFLIIFNNFLDREKFVLFYGNLQLYLRLGFKLKKLHGVLEFNQSQWLKPFVQFNILKRKKARKWRQRWNIFVQIN